MPKRKLTPNQLEFEKQIKRLTRLQSKAELEGLAFPRHLIIPQPTRVTQGKLKELKSVTLRSLREEIKAPRVTQPTDGDFKKPRATENDVYIRHPRIRRDELPEQRTPEQRNTEQSTPNPRTPKSRTPLSPEELHRRRSEGAKKAAETRRRKAEQDIEYARRQREARRANIKKAQEARRKKHQKQLPPPIETVEYPVSNEPIYESDIVLSNIIEELSNSTKNIEVCKFIIEKIAEKEAQIGRNEMARLAQESEFELKENVHSIIYASRQPMEEIERCARAVLGVFQINDYATLEEIAYVAHEDFAILKGEKQAFRQYRNDFREKYGLKKLD